MQKVFIGLLGLMLIDLVHATTVASGVSTMNLQPIKVASMVNSKPKFESAQLAHVSSINLKQSMNKNASGVANFAALSAIDNSADDLIQIRRKLELEKAQMELKQVQNGGIGGSSGNIGMSENSQTTVTGVAINAQGKKIAWLQFTDGGTLVVNIGSQVGKYSVTDIGMTGVTLTDFSGKKHRAHNIFLKRAYLADQRPRNQSGGGNNFLNIPSPILTNANSGNSNEMVPPIISTR